MTKNNIRFIGLTIVLTFIWAVSIFADATKTRINVGYFEGGKYPGHEQLRAELQKQLELILPENYEIVFIPEGYRSAGWHRDSCRIMAKELTEINKLDMVVTMGPWVVEDLLEAGFKKPIVAMYRYDPIAEGLIGQDRKPIAENLTIRTDLGKLENDLTTIAKLFKPQKIGILFFPSGNEQDRVISRARLIGQELGFEVISAVGYDNTNTFAFFNAYNNLNKRIDVLYLPPMWGMDIIKVKEFLNRVNQNHIPTFCSENRYLVEKGAVASNAGYTFFPQARFTAEKIIEIINGARPADLPVEFSETRGLSINREFLSNCRAMLPINAFNEAFVIEAPPPDDAPYYTLTGAINRALERNPDYLARYDVLEAAVQEAKQAYSDYLPQLSAHGFITHFDDNTVENARQLIEENRYTASFSFNQQIFSLKTLAEIQIAAKNKNLEETSLKQAALDLELAVTLTYLNYIQAEELLKVRKQHRDLIDRQLEIAHTMFRLDENRRADYIRWEDERTKGTMGIITARVNLDIARVILNVLLNMPGNSLFTLEGEGFTDEQFRREYLNFYPLIATDPDRQNLQDALVMSALEKNPEIQKNEIQIDIFKKSLTRNTARFLPTVGFQASLNFKDELAETLTFEEKHNTWSVTGYLTLPLFRGTDRISERRKLKAQLSASEFRKDAASLQIMNDIQTTTHLLFSQAYNVPLSIKSQNLARDNYEIVALNYENGTRNITDLLNAQKNVLDAESEYVLTRYGFYRTLSKLVHDIGWLVSENNTTFKDEFYSRINAEISDER